VADCSPLTGENRVLVQEGLKILSKTKRQGFVALAKAAKVELPRVDSFGVGFYLAPRINSAGRLDHANAAYKLLATESYGIAKLLSYQLELSNRKRQKITENIYREIKKDLDTSRKVLLVHKKDWPLGVLGIVASKLCEEYFKPTLVLTKGKEESSGSARSIPNFNIIKAINECSDLLLEFGGHSGAAGCSLVNENIDKFSDKINKIADEKLNDEDLIPKIDIEAEINLKNIDWELYNELEKLKPFGASNEKPQFKASNVQVMSFDRIGKSKDHLKLMLCDKDGKGQIEGVYFNIKSAKLKQLDGDIDLVFEIDCNEWGGKRDLQLRMVDFRRAKK
jgi:single-stranded-DNA-specific exonuclease